MKSNVEYYNPQELRKELQQIADSLNLPLTIEIMEQRLLLIADELGIDVMEWRVIEEYLKRYENKFPRVITREVLSLYFDYNDEDCIPINPNRKRVGDGFYSY